MKTSSAGVHMIATFEGFPNGGRPYNDPVGLATVGYGHLIARRRVIGSDSRAKWLADQQRPGALTHQEAERLLATDLASREAAALRLVKVHVSQHQFDAIVSLIYNIGEGGFAQSTVIRRLNAGDYAGAADAFMMWNKAGSPPRPFAGLTHRREVERACFLNGDGGGDSGAGNGDDADGDPFAGYTASEVAWIREYDKLRREGTDLERRRVLRRVMAEQRKRIWKVAQPRDHGGDGRGWTYGTRRERYHSLLVRTRP